MTKAWEREDKELESSVGFLLSGISAGIHSTELILAFELCLFCV
jgi:hypothetical protein